MAHLPSQHGLTPLTLKQSLLSRSQSFLRNGPFQQVRGLPSQDIQQPQIALGGLVRLRPVGREHSKQVACA